MGNTSAAFGSRGDVDRVVDALASAHISLDTVRLVTSVDGAMTEVNLLYQWWGRTGALVGGLLGAVAGPALYFWVADLPGGLGHATLAGAMTGVAGGALGGFGTWRLRFALLPGASITQYVVLVEVPDARRREVEGVFRRHGGLLVPSDGASIA